MVRSEQESPVPEIGMPGLMRRGLETGPWGPYTGTKLETAETAKGNLPVPRQSSTLLLAGGCKREAWRWSGGGLPTWPLGTSGKRSSAGAGRAPATKRTHTGHRAELPEAVAGVP